MSFPRMPVKKAWPHHHSKVSMQKEEDCNQGSVQGVDQESDAFVEPCSQIRHAWDRSKTVSQNLAEMGLAVDPNKAVPIRKEMKMDVDGQETRRKIVRKPYVINELEYEASLPEKKSETLSKDLIDYVQHMIRNYGENFKKMARDEKNYYQDTPKQIKRKINVYKRFYPEEYQAFIDSLKQEKMDEQ